ncbi:glycosyltransferase family 9 protein [bacterium]|nr:glycosyltransferase family 9 protein [bacterium]
MKRASRLRLSEIRSALFIRIKSLGDTVLFTPAIYNFKRACPHARLSVLVDEPSATAIAGNPDVDEIIISPSGSRPMATARFVFKLLLTRFDLAIDFHGGPRGNMATFFSDAKCRVGWRDRPLSFCYYNIRVPMAREVLKTDTKLHTVAKNLALIVPLGVPVVSTQTRVFIDPSASQSLDKKLRHLAQNVGKPLLLVHVGATKSRKEYPPERLANVLASCLSDTPWQPVLVGGKEDLPRCEAVCQSLPEDARRDVISLVGKLSLLEVKSLCDKADAFLGPDSGLMHLADALGTPCVVLLGKTDLRLWHPWQSPHIILRPCPHLTCSPSCPHYTPREGCIGLTTEEQVLCALSDIEDLAL